MNIRDNRQENILPVSKKSKEMGEIQKIWRKRIYQTR